MQIKFTSAYKVKQGDGKGPEYAVDQVVNFKGSVEETYARKYIRLGVAVEYDEKAERKAAELAAKAEADAKAKAQQQGGGQQQ